MHVVGIVLILAGLLGLVLSLLVWGPLNPSRRRDHLRRSNGEAPPVVVEERRIYHGQPPM